MKYCPGCIADIQWCRPVFFILLSGLVFFMAGCASSDTDGPSNQVFVDHVSFISQEIPVKVDVYRTNRLDPGPGVLLFHGVGGMRGDGPMLKRQAEALAQQGFTAAIVHYFDITRTTFPPGKKAIDDNFAWWEAAVRDAIGYVSSRRDVRPSKVGLVGYSLGGYLAVAVAAKDSRVGAVVTLCAGAPQEAEGYQNLPPLLVIYAKNDQKIPPQEAERLLRIARQLGGSTQGHQLFYEKHSLTREGEATATRLMQPFLARYLKL